MCRVKSLSIIIRDHTFAILERVAKVAYVRTCRELGMWRSVITTSATRDYECHEVRKCKFHVCTSAFITIISVSVFLSASLQACKP